MARVCFIAAFLLTFISRDTQAIVCARNNKKPDVNFVKTHVTDTNSAKSFAEFRAYRREIILIVISNDMCVGNYTSQATSVEINRLRRLIYARSGLQKIKKEGHRKTMPFFLKLSYLLAFAALKASISIGVTLNRSPQIP